MQGRKNWRELRAFEIYSYFTGDGSSITNRLSARTTTLMAGTISNAPLPTPTNPLGLLMRISYGSPTATA
jgi:hypothetical protein